MKLHITTAEVALLVRLLSTTLEESPDIDGVYARALNRLQQKFIDAEEGASEKKKELRHAAALLERLSASQTRSYDKKVLADAAEHLDAAADVEGAC